MIIKAFSDDFFSKVKSIRKQKILFFNGCFDIVHLGHLMMIKEIKEYAKRFNYSIICGLNSDESVKKQNKSHPLINDELNRANFLEMLGIEKIIIFDEETPLELLMYLMPDIVFKGEEYENKTYAEKEFLKRIECNVKYSQKYSDYSTTAVYNKIAEFVKDDIRRNI